MCETRKPQQATRTGTKQYQNNNSITHSATSPYLLAGGDKVAKTQRASLDSNRIFRDFNSSSSASAISAPIYNGKKDRE